MQRFKRGDKVRVADDLGECRSHFRSGFDAIVMGSYASQCGGTLERDHSNYTLMACDDGNELSWYDGSVLTFIEHAGSEAIKAIKQERKDRAARESDMEWIWANWATIREKPPGATMGQLMRQIGITNPWGSHGEGFVYWANAMATFEYLDAVLLSGDREAFATLCQQAKQGSGKST